MSRPSKNINECTHTKIQIKKKPRWWDDVCSDDEYKEKYEEEYEEVYTTVDIDISRYKCTKCGEIMYYSYYWKLFWENGEPCLGSDQFI